MVRHRYHRRFEASTKRDRSTFLYMEPKQPAKDFAQCSSCLLWTGAATKRCVPLGPNFEVEANDSCGLYSQAIKQSALQAPETTYEDLQSVLVFAAVTPQEAGFVQGQVRCENCSAFKDGSCLFFQSLNEKMPAVFKLDVKVSPQGCCNAWAD